MVTYTDIKACPISTAFLHIGKKWTLNILRDLFRGEKQFSGFLKSNPGISAKMLSLRLSELCSSGLVEKNVTPGTPVVIEYELTPKGRDLDKILYEMAVFSMKNYSSEIFKVPVKGDQTKTFSKITKAVLQI